MPNSTQTNMPNTDFAPLTVLLVEDDDTHAHVIRRHLAKSAEASLKLHHEECFSAALEFLAASEVDAVLLDLALPDCEISETLPKFLESHDDVPVIVLTSLDDLEFATRAVQQGAQDYLVKSDLNGALLLRSIRYAIQRKQAQDELESYAAELEQSNEHLQAFAHTVAHEVKSPLDVINMCLHVVNKKHERSFDQDTRDAVEDAAAAVRAVAELVNDLLDFAQVGAEETEFTELDVEAVFYQAYVMLRPAIKQSRACVTHDPLPAVRGNEVQIRQLLLNLIGNAVKYGGERPEVHVGVDSSPDRWTFHVQDNGIGIPSEDQDRIFDVFVRLQNTPDTSGTGIGLALCRRIVEHHGGRIWVESAAGGGSIFHFTLPK